VAAPEAITHFWALLSAGWRSSLGSALRGLLGGLESKVAAAADLLGRAVGELDCPGRVLAAANTALPAAEDATGRLWQAATVSSVAMRSSSAPDSAANASKARACRLST
jgi:hypothetical protein